MSGPPVPPKDNLSINNALSDKHSRASTAASKVSGISTKSVDAKVLRHSETAPAKESLPVSSGRNNGIYQTDYLSLII